MRTNSLYVLTVVVCVLLTAYGCGKRPDDEIILVSIGDTEITVSDFNERISHLPPRYREIVKKRKKEYLDEYVNDTLLYQEAVRRNVHKDKDVQKIFEEARKKILIARLLKDEVDDSINITEEEIIEFYSGNRDKYMTPEIMRVSHILVPTRKEAESIAEELAKEANFEDLARAKSVDPTAQRGGDIGYFPKGQLMPEFERACAKLDVDEVSAVVRTNLGYHIIKLTDRREPEARPIEQVADDIRSRLRTVKRQRLFNELLNNLKEKTNVEINEKALSRVGENKEE